MFIGYPFQVKLVGQGHKSKFKVTCGSFFWLKVTVKLAKPVSVHCRLV